MIIFSNPHQSYFCLGNPCYQKKVGFIFHFRTSGTFLVFTKIHLFWPHNPVLFSDNDPFWGPAKNLSQTQKSLHLHCFHSLLCVADVCGTRNQPIWQYPDISWELTSLLQHPMVWDRERRSRWISPEQCPSRTSRPKTPWRYHTEFPKHCHCC